MFAILKDQFVKVNLFLTEEEPVIVQFQEERYRIRKKTRFEKEYKYLDLIDAQESKEINWRSNLTCDRVHSCCSNVCVVATKKAFDTYQELQHNQVSSTPVSKEDLKRLLFTTRLKKTKGE